MQMSRKPITKESLATQLYNGLRMSLMDGQYSPGERLTISGIAEEFGTSTTPVREAIFRLVSERALVLRTATAVQVPDLDFASLREIQSIRIELEGLAARRAAERINKDELAELKAINAQFIEAAAKSPDQASLLNRDFHFAIMRFSGLPIVESVCANMWVQMGPFLRMFHDQMPKRQLSSENHKHFELLAAIERRDPAGSEAAMQDDIRWGEELLASLEEKLRSAKRTG